MIIKDAKYNAMDEVNTSLTAIIDGKLTSVPLDPANTDYAEILRQVAAGTLTIEDAD